MAQEDTVGGGPSVENADVPNAALETSAHWNDGIPGSWSKLRRLDEVGSYVATYCSGGGVYRLVALAEPGVSTPAILDRICGRDQTGTLYIGCADALGSRLSKLVRSLRRPKREWVTNREHNAGYLLRRNTSPSLRFPTTKLAVTWSNHPRPLLAEGHLLLCYRAWFGEGPPLNRQHE
jgi:hypothetical protein